MHTRYTTLLSLSLLAQLAQAQNTSPADSLATTPAAVAPASTLPEPPKDPRDKPSFIPAPVFFYQPETGFALGAAFLPVWRFGRDSTTTRKSNARLIGWYSQKKQTSLQLLHNVFTRDERWLLTGEISYYDYPIFFYGIGNDTKTRDESEISYQLLTFDQRVLKNVVGRWFLGARYRLTDLRNIQVDEPLTNDEGSQRPNLLYDLPARQRENTMVSGLGPSLIHDGRDNILNTYRGHYLELQGLFNTKGLGSDYTFTRYILDARHFEQLGGTNTIWASQLYAQFHNGDVPFRELATLGGANLLRGIYEGRFRGRQLVALQTELRKHLFWRINGAAFVGVGQVANHLDDLRFTEFNVAGGAGLRFQFNRRDRLNIRLDYGVGSGKSSGLYFGVSEAF
ncbi:BamA/TamA family outer membrane protein [Hymenobacter sp. CRA2]|uniref:BamA/TamA family outer membrane protein n=1 Tax=Hymenobacter sp. CRA2 TaxID=1955620 RepID=UPI00098F2AF5|nr:BamA/TamA family outer membrane protein [Hymenobacter sp. CRA2]OON66804.1 hypothetical protein B0919_20795 [Hymenobacter sp. CRA2]